MELASGAESRLVVIPTASASDSFGVDFHGLQTFRNVQRIRQSGKNPGDQKRTKGYARNQCSVWQLRIYMVYMIACRGH